MSSDITTDDLQVYLGQLANIQLYRKVTDEEFDRLAREAGYVKPFHRIEVPLDLSTLDATDRAKALRALLTDECETCGESGLELREDRSFTNPFSPCPECVGGWVPKDGVVLDWRCFVAELNPEHPIKDANADGTPERCRYSGGHSSRCGWRLLVEVDWLEADHV